MNISKKIKKTKTCWLWQGTITWAGYGRLYTSGKFYQAHRYIYELERGKIPQGKVCDHICRVRHCVNPDHIELVSDQINILRGVGISALNARKTHCKRGHEFTPENTRISRQGTRVCRICHKLRARGYDRRAYWQQYYAKRKLQKSL